VDALYPAADDPRLIEFIKAFPYIPWPGFYKELFIEGMRGRLATFLDVYHPVRRLFEEYVKDKSEPQISATLFEWDSTDPLVNIFLALFGTYPTMDEIGKDYSDFVERNLRGKRVQLRLGDSIPSDAYNALTPSAIAAFDLKRDRDVGWGNPGFYVGNAGDFVDVVNFWNLRAADIDLVFYDPAHDVRFHDLRAAYLGALTKRPEDPAGWSDRIAIWSKGTNHVDATQFGPKIIRCTVAYEIWNGLNVKPPVVYLDDQSVLATVSEDSSAPTLSFQLPEKPFYEEPEFHLQQVVVSVRPRVDASKTDKTTFRPPYIRELNEYYGREAHFGWNEARAEAGGLGIITHVTKGDMTIRGLPKRQLVAKIFQAFGMKAEPSQAGLIAERLIEQMGGLQGCRVFKIPGVRRLVQEYGPSKAFSMKKAVRLIRGADSPEDGTLFIEGKEASPANTFLHLIKRGAFRAGLNLNCPNCQLDSWVHLDNLSTKVNCEYCGTSFDITPQLHRVGWQYRRSGLFGKEDHQEGSIPVALTLQQLDTLLHWEAIFVTATNISPLTAKIPQCETDFVVLAQMDYQEKPQLAIGECKTGGPKNEIAQDDVAKLTSVADAFPQDRIETYIVFSKTAPFTAEEVARCREAQSPHRLRVILLSDRELEPYFVYEKTEEEFDIRGTAISLDDLARNTHDVFFEPKHKATNTSK